MYNVLTNSSFKLYIIKVVHERVHEGHYRIRIQYVVYGLDSKDGFIFRCNSNYELFKTK